MFGIDPSITTIMRGHALNVERGYFPKDIPETWPRFSLVTSIACFYDADDPVAFARAVRDTLRPGGRWCVEVADLAAMVENGAYDAVCHEHLCYYDLDSLTRVAERAGLGLKKFSRNGCNGGSLRCYFGHPEDGENLRPYSPATDLEGFADRVQSARQYLIEQVNDCLRHGKTIHLLGASTKIGTVLQFCGLTAKEIPFASDRDPLKHGLRIPGTGIPIVSEEQSRAMKPDVYLVGPWHFRDEIMARERQAGSRATFLWPMPGLPTNREAVCV